MKRRDAIKRMGYAAGFVMVTPTILGILNSCTTEVAKWTPKFLMPEQAEVLIKLVNIFLPKTSLPSATDVNVPEFIDRYVDEIFTIEDQQIFKAAFGNTMTKISEHQGIEVIDDIEDSQLKAFLDEHLMVKGEVDTEREANPDFKGKTTSEFLNTIKTMTIQAYLTNEKIGEEVLAYEPIPGAYYCGDLKSLTNGKSWSLN
jgi:hypothetical protein